jgi:hypothetical protein
MVIGQFTFECRRRVFFTFHGNGHELRGRARELGAADQDLRGTDSLVEGAPMNFLRG